MVLFFSVGVVFFYMYVYYVCVCLYIFVEILLRLVSVKLRMVCNGVLRYYMGDWWYSVNSSVKFIYDFMYVLGLVRLLGCCLL